MTAFLHQTKYLARLMLGAVSPTALSRLDLMRRRARYLREPSRGPQRIMLELTTACSHRCEMCGCHSPRVTPRLPARHMPFEQVERLLRDAAHMGVEWVWLVGRGESLVHPRAEDILRLIGALGMSSAITTNGHRLTPQLASSLSSYGLRQLSLSVNAGRPDTYARIHHAPPEERARVLSVIAGLAREQDRPKLLMSMVVTKPNVSEVLDFTRDAIAAGVDQAVICGMRPVPFYAADLTLDEDDWRRVRDDIAAARDLAAPSRTLVVTDGIPSGDAPQIAAWPYQQMACFIAHQFAAIDADGLVHGCCSCQNRLGSLNAAPFSIIWHSPAYRTYRTMLRQLPVTGLTPPSCDCRYGCGHVAENASVQEDLALRFVKRAAKTPHTTRLDMVVCLARAFADALPPGQPGAAFADLLHADPAAQQAAARLRQLGVFQGTGWRASPLLDPTRILARAEVAEALRRTLSALGMDTEGAAAAVTDIVGEAASDPRPAVRREAQEWAARAAARLRGASQGETHEPRRGT